MVDSKYLNQIIDRYRKEYGLKEVTIVPDEKFDYFVWDLMNEYTNNLVNRIKDGFDKIYVEVVVDYLLDPERIGDVKKFLIKYSEEKGKGIVDHVFLDGKKYWVVDREYLMRGREDYDVVVQRIRKKLFVPTRRLSVDDVMKIERVIKGKILDDEDIIDSTGVVPVDRIDEYVWAMIDLLPLWVRDYFEKHGIEGLKEYMLEWMPGHRDRMIYLVDLGNGKKVYYFDTWL